MAKPAPKLAAKSAAPAIAKAAVSGASPAPAKSASQTPLPRTDKIPEEFKDNPDALEIFQMTQADPAFAKRMMDTFVPDGMVHPLVLDEMRKAEGKSSSSGPKLPAKTKSKAATSKAVPKKTGGSHSDLEKSLIKASLYC